MPRTARSDRKPTAPGFTEPAVAAVFDAQPAAIRRQLLKLRTLILDTAAATPGVGGIEETLKWGQPSYLTAETKSGTTIRIDAVRDKPGQVALYVHCQTRLVEQFRELYAGALGFEGNRAILVDVDKALPTGPLSHCIAMALTYHASKKPAGRRTRV
ncbi:MAG: DUF1801 domain-containing protein [Bauldia sp.]|uniref:DUF1801 domain-containing protein n=1 Tax=Bauldia sp. TaxID=2575872 RepID=UPI001DE28C82|nr:DUF1801 domain-containing protein [Bauldia sp.]MCB1494270.1 DUF1801 domain-containing protein [Bauldia sp.]